MAHLIQTFEDLVDLLDQQPDLRPRLLRVLLTEDFLHLPERVDRLEEALTKFTHQVFLLAESHKELLESHIAVRAEVKSLAQGQKDLMELTQQTLNLMRANTNAINMIARNLSSLTDSVESINNSQKAMGQEIRKLSERLT